MEYNELVKHAPTLEEMGKTAINGKNFREIDNWVLYVYETNQSKRFGAVGFAPDSSELNQLYNDWKHTIYSNVRKMLADEKVKYANVMDCYTPAKPRGETYGYLLKEPYTIEEITDFEKAIGERLPEDLRDYLLYVSRELKTYAYPYTFELHPAVQTFVIPDGKTLVMFDEMYDLTTSANADTVGMLQIGEGGCAFSHWIVVKGKHKGTIWYNLFFIFAMFKTSNHLAGSFTGEPSFYGVAI